MAAEKNRLLPMTSDMNTLSANAHIPIPITTAPQIYKININKKYMYSEILCLS